jgi:hypothetical protein
MEITVTIPEVLASNAKLIGVPPDVYVTRLLNQFAVASAGKGALARELRADWDDFKATDLHLDEDEVDNWLAQLEVGQFVEPPALHTER